MTSPKAQRLAESRRRRGRIAFANWAKHHHVGTARLVGDQGLHAEGAGLQGGFLILEEDRLARTHVQQSDAGMAAQDKQPGLVLRPNRPLRAWNSIDLFKDEVGGGDEKRSSRFESLREGPGGARRHRRPRRPVQRAAHEIVHNQRDERLCRCAVGFRRSRDRLRWREWSQPEHRRHRHTQPLASDPLEIDPSAMASRSCSEVSGRSRPRAMRPPGSAERTYHASDLPRASPIDGRKSLPDEPGPTAARA